MGEARKHHFISRFLLRGFSIPEEDNGRLYVLDRTRKIVFKSSPLNSGHRRDYNRVEKATHPDPLAIENFYADIESRAAPALHQMKTSKSMPAKGNAAKVLDLVAIHLTRTPRFRRWLEGKFFEVFEDEIMKMGRNKPAKRRFSQKQRKYGLPEDCCTPEGFLSRLKSGEFSIESDDNWKIALTVQQLPILVNYIRQRNWFMLEYPTSFEPLIISDAAVGLLAMGPPSPMVVGLGLPTTIIYLPLSTRLVLVGVYQEARQMVENEIHPRILNTNSFAFCLDQCFATENDFVIDDPDRGPTNWTSYLQEGEFPNLYNDSGDLADVYAGNS